MRILAITAGTFLLFFMILMTVRLSGRNEVYVPFDTTYFHGKSPYGIVPWEQSYLLEKNPELILWMNVYRNKHEELLVQPWADRTQQEIDLDLSSSPTRPKLKDLLKTLLQKFPSVRFIINCNQNVDNIHENLAQVIDETKSDDHVMIQSDYDTIPLSLKPLKPRLVYGSSISDITRMRSFESLWILPAAPFKGDVYFTSFKYHGVDAIDDAIVEEIHRRQKKVFLGPLSTKAEVEQALGLGVDGLFVSDPFLLPRP